jgi:hypothetical protein
MNEGESVASFCCQVAAFFPDMFCGFYFLKNHKIAKNSTTTKAREKIKQNDTQYNDDAHCDTQHYNKNVTITITTQM